MVGYETVSYLDANKYLMGTSSGYIIIDLDKLNQKTYQISINTVTNYSIEGKSSPIKLMGLSEFENKRNNLEFTFSVAEFDKYLEAEYQYKLSGYYEQWSDWSTNSSVLFKNLPYGK